MRSQTPSDKAQAPRDTSIEVPGQLPVRTLDPVNALKSVDLPEFWAPTRATDGDPLGAGDVSAAQCAQLGACATVDADWVSDMVNNPLV